MEIWIWREFGVSKGLWVKGKNISRNLAPDTLATFPLDDQLIRKLKKNNLNCIPCRLRAASPSAIGSYLRCFLNRRVLHNQATVGSYGSLMFEMIKLVVATGYTFFGGIKWSLPIGGFNPVAKTRFVKLEKLVGAQPPPCCSFARHLGKMVIHFSFAHHDTHSPENLPPKSGREFSRVESSSNNHPSDPRTKNWAASIGVITAINGRTSALSHGSCSIAHRIHGTNDIFTLKKTFTRKIHEIHGSVNIPYGCF